MQLQEWVLSKEQFTLQPFTSKIMMVGEVNVIVYRHKHSCNVSLCILSCNWRWVLILQWKFGGIPTFAPRVYNHLDYDAANCCNLIGPMEVF